MAVCRTTIARLATVEDMEEELKSVTPSLLVCNGFVYPLLFSQLSQ